MSGDSDQGFLEGMFIRYVAGAIIVACVGLLAYLNRDKLVDRPDEEAVQLNPDFVACRDKRVGDVQKMLDEGVINAESFKVFKQRATDTCAGQFPPGG